MSGRRGRPLDGWLLLDKPAGITSAGAVARCKRLLDARKVGHGGTLDPFATGLLPLAFGAATKTVPYVMDGTKLYRFTLRFGEARDTDDRDGAAIARSDHRPDDAAIEAALPRFRGEIVQVPPAFSALKVAGRRAYDLARDGAAVVLAPRPARVDRFDLVERPDADHAVFAVASGKGVYMRALARDLARALGTVGHVASLRRLAVGPFGIAQTISLDNLAASAENAHAFPDMLLPIATALADIPALALTREEADRLSHGIALALGPVEDRVPDAAAGRPDALVRAMAGKHVIGLCRLSGGVLRPERLLQRPNDGE